MTSRPHRVILFSLSLIFFCGMTYYPGPAEPCIILLKGSWKDTHNGTSTHYECLQTLSTWSFQLECGDIPPFQRTRNATHTTARSLPRYLQTPHSIPKPHQQPQCTSSPWYSLSGNTKWQERKSYHHRLHNYFHYFHHTEVTA